MILALSESHECAGIRIPIADLDSSYVGSLVTEVILLKFAWTP